MNKEIAIGLLKINAVKFSPQDPFLYASGLRGPIYCDNRMVLSHVDYRNLIISGFIEMIEEKKLSFDLLGGVATAGIPCAAIVADRLSVPMVYVRPKPKGHGKKNQVEGDYVEGMRVLLFEDLVNQGASLEEAITGTVNCQLKVSDCLCIVDYQTREAQKRLNQLGITLHSLTNFAVLVEAAFELKLISQAEKDDLKHWHDDPVLWSQRFLENA